MVQNASTGPNHEPTADPDRQARVRELSRAHVFNSWAAQAAFDPPPLAGGSGAWLWDHGGRRFLDFTSQLVNVNIGYQHPKLIAAIREAAGDLVTIGPAFASETRAQAAQLISSLAPDGLTKVFFTTGGAEAVEHAVRMARGHTGRSKVLASYRSYHGSTAGAGTLTGEARRWPIEPGLPGVVHFWGPHLYRTVFHATTPEEESARALAHLRQTIEAEGPHLVAAVVLESVVGSNGILVPPPGYLQGVRQICDDHGILLVTDEVMAGFGRTGRWFAFDRWGITPDLITFAKGVNSGYIPLGGMIISDAVAASFDDVVYPGGLTYSGHPLATASALASIRIMQEEGIPENSEAVGEQVIGPMLADLAQRYEVIGDARGLATFWCLDLVADRATKAPLPAADVTAIATACRERGMWPLVMGNRIHLTPPCVITPDEARQGLQILDEALADVAR